MDETGAHVEDEDIAARRGELDLAGQRACGLTTHTQSQWGAVCSGDNIGCARDQHFMSAFPEGLIVGCGVLTANLVTPKAVEVALPAAGTSRALLQGEAVAFDGYGDPKVGTGFFGQVVALGLNIGFDTMTGDGQFALEDLVVSNPTSPCLGMTVGQVYDEANLALGGCPSELSAVALNQCVLGINKSFADGLDACTDVLSIPAPPPQ